jgi:alkylation response protein AidB-like acyl-CoA dehydrogenase
MFFPVAAARVLDTWHTGGMRGTGSHDFVAEGVAVTEGYGFDIFNGRGRIDRPLYRLPFPIWFGSGVAAVALGIARRAIRCSYLRSDAQRSQRPSRASAMSPTRKQETAPRSVPGARRSPSERRGGRRPPA